MHDCARSDAISLRLLFPQAEIRGANDIRVRSCCADSRRCREGDLFVALPGEQHDGHAFVGEAVRRGAAAVLAERQVEGCDVPLCLVSDSREAYGRLCQALAGNPSQRLKVVGVTGTNGKTTTSFLVAGVLEAGGFAPGLIGTLGCYDGADVRPSSLTTPSSPTLAKSLARMESNGCTHVVMEVSSHALAQSRVAGVDFDVACFTNIRHDHLDFHHTPQRYVEAKASLLERLHVDGLAVFNVDDPVVRSLVDRHHGPALTVAIEQAAEVSAVSVERCPSEQMFLLTIGDETAPVRTTLIGDHNIRNCLVAAAVGFGYGLELTTIVRGLESVRNVPGRLERIECGQPFSVFVDYAHTPDALQSALTALRPLTSGRLVCVFGAGGDRDQQKRPLMGSVAESLADEVVLTTDNPRDEEPRAIIDDILHGFSLPQRARVVVDRAEAIRRSIESARPGDCVLIAGKGHEAYQIVGARRVAFDDREVARRFLYAMYDSGELPRAA